MEITRDDIAAAQQRIQGDIRRTPLLRLRGAQLGIDCAELWLKLEQLQVGGSFKARGMFNRMRSHPLPEAGVVIASGGNAGIAVAVAAKALGVRCEVFVPESSSPAKRAKLAELGAVLTVIGASYADALGASLVRQAASVAGSPASAGGSRPVAGAMPWSRSTRPPFSGPGKRASRWTWK